MMPEVMEMFLQYVWPGNIRELSHTIERLVVLNTGGLIRAEDLPPDMFVIRENNGTHSDRKDPAVSRVLPPQTTRFFVIPIIPFQN